MGQGRSVRPFWRMILLIALAIQGLTPDLHDLASSSALRLLCPDLTEQSPFALDDDMPDEVCDLLQWSQGPDLARERAGPGLTDLAHRGGIEETTAFPIDESGLDVPSVMRVRPLVYELCRITC